MSHNFDIPKTVEDAKNAHGPYSTFCLNAKNAHGAYSPLWLESKTPPKATHINESWRINARLGNLDLYDKTIKKEVVDAAKTLPKIVCIDLDKTITYRHTSGRYHKDRIDNFAQKWVCDDIPQFIRALLENKVHVAVTTHSDSEMQNGDKNYLAGEAMVKRILLKHLTKQEVEKIHIEAFHPELHEHALPYKKQHILNVLHKINDPLRRRGKELVEVKDVVLIDDTEDNVLQAADDPGCNTIFVPSGGFKLEYWIDALYWDMGLETLEGVNDGGSDTDYGTYSSDSDSD